MNKAEQEFIKALTDGSFARATEECADSLAEMSLAWGAALVSATAFLRTTAERRAIRARVLEWEGVWLWD